MRVEALRKTATVCTRVCVPVSFPQTCVCTCIIPVLPKKLRFGTTSTADFGRPRIAVVPLPFPEPFVYPGTVEHCVSLRKFSRKTVIFFGFKTAKGKTRFLTTTRTCFPFVDGPREICFFLFPFLTGLRPSAGTRRPEGLVGAGGGGAHPILRGPGSLFTVTVRETVFALTVSGNS